MKSTFSGILLAMGAALSISAVAAQSTLPKEGDVVCSGVFHVMSNNVSMGEDVSQYSYQAVGGLLTEKEETLLDRMSGRCVGSGRVVKGTLETETGMCEFIDLTGDKLFTTTSSTKGDIGTKHTLAGGTGKYTGITGGWTSVRRSLRSPIEGQGIVVITYKGSYKLP